MTDLKCLDAARNVPHLVPSRLAEIADLSSSATTVALDCLERRGFVRRIRDQHDRRRVFVVSTGRHEAETTRLFSPLTTATTTILDNYPDEQLAPITDFLEQLNTVSEQLIKHHNTQASSHATPALAHSTTALTQRDHSDQTAQVGRHCSSSLVPYIVVESCIR
jgi:DNA-binding MarR family transcriptional regulator